MDAAENGHEVPETYNESAPHRRSGDGGTNLSSLIDTGKTSAPT